ncbi:MAG: glycerol-3-phosphate 1-O-acyltransferase PlsY [Dehalococcoidia bacterium]|nr:glycerol-3-phosphate 1-O-acyltransferase PlsY [Dehalococcoidia bacterium]
MIVYKLIAVILIPYLIGSIPFGVIIGKWAAGVDPRNYGSGKTGGTNVMRILGAKVGILVIALDIAKAACAVSLSSFIFGTTVGQFGSFYVDRQIAEMAASLAVISGHNWPVFLKFRGGRGVATFFGALLPIAPAAAIFGAEVLGVVAVSTRYMSAGSIAGAMAAWAILVPLTLFSSFPPVFLAVVLMSTCLVLYQHRDNIKRLRAGIERKVGEKADRPQAKGRRMATDNV